MISRVHSSLLLLAFGLLGTSACTNLTPIEAELCGNAIVEHEVGEDCDGGDQCGLPTAGAKACRITCEKGQKGEPDVVGCPEGMGCGTDGICREHSGVFELVVQRDSLTLFAQTDDIDGDGQLDVLRASGTSTVAQFYTQGFSLAATSDIAREPGDVPPILGQLSFDSAGDPDGRADVAVNVEIGAGDNESSGLAVYTSQTDRTLAPSSYANLKVNAVGAYGLRINVSTPHSVDEVISFVGNDGTNGGLIGLNQTGGQEVMEVAAPLHPLAVTGATVANVLPASACEELIWTAGGAGQAAARNKLYILEPCTTAGDQEVWDTSTTPNLIELDLGRDAFNWRESNQVVDLVKFVPGFRSGVYVADFDNDGIDDIGALVNDPLRPLVFFKGDGTGTWTGPPLPVDYVILRAGQPNDTGVEVVLDACEDGSDDLDPDELGLLGAGIPLLIEDFTGDGLLDFVTDNAIWLSFMPPGGTDPVWDVVDECLSMGQAVSADFDNDLDQDFAYSVLGEPNIDVAMSSGDGVFTYNLIASERPVSFMTSGDFDGDAVADLAFFELDLDTIVSGGEDAEASDSVSVAFGASSGGFDDPIGVGTLKGVRGVISGRLEGGDGTDDMLVVTDDQSDELALAIFSGSGSRQIVAPFIFSTPGGRAEINAMASGNFFGGAPSKGLAVVTSNPEGSGSILWPVNVEGNAQLVTSLSKTHEVPECGENCVLAALDLNEDGLDEVILLTNRIASNLDFEGVGLVFRATGDTSNPWAEPVEFATGNLCGFDHFFSEPQIGDADGDGIPDLAVVGANCESLNNFEYFGGGTEAVVFFNDGSGSLSPENSTPVGLSGDADDFVSALSFVNLDNDDSAELVVSVISSQQFGPLTDIGETRFFDVDDPNTVVTFDEGFPLLVEDNELFYPAETFLPGDFNGDGVQDLILTTFGSYSILRGVPVR